MWRMLGILISVILVAGACAPDGTAPDGTVSPGPTLAAGLVGDPVAEAARGLAIALGDPGRRQAFLAASRGSPYREQKLDFNRALDRAWFGSLLVGAAEATGRSVPEMLGFLRSLPDLELYVPVQGQRERWAGDEEVVVVGTSLTDAQVKRLGLSAIPGYRPDGTMVMVSMTDQPAWTLISLVPKEIDFSQMPSFAQCNEETCGGTGGGGGGNPPTYSGWYIDQIRMVYAPWSYDGVPFGQPEFEVWLARYNPVSEFFEVPLDAQGKRPCASEAYSSGVPEHFNYDNPPNLYGDDFLFSHGTQTQLNAIYGDGVSIGGYLWVIENDDTSCPSAEMPALGEFDNTDIGNDDDFVGYFALPISGTVYSFSNPYATDPGLVVARYATNRTF